MRAQVQGVQRVPNHGESFAVAPRLSRATRMTKLQLRGQATGAPAVLCRAQPRDLEYPVKKHCPDRGRLDGSRQARGLIVLPIVGVKRERPDGLRSPRLKSGSWNAVFACTELRSLRAGMKFRSGSRSMSVLSNACLVWLSKAPLRLTINLSY
jgi:hypothetical protein